MSPTTPRFSLPYPVAPDPADVPSDIQALAEATDAALVVGPNPGNLELPGAPADVTASRVLGTAYQPSTTRPVMVVATITAQSLGNAPSSIVLEIGATTATATSIATVYVLSTDAGAVQLTQTLSVIVPAGWYYKLAVGVAGALQMINHVYETTL